jgi:hypothetical protein
MKTQFSAVIISAMISTAPATYVADNSSTTKETAKIEQVETTGFAFFRTHRQGKAGITASWGLTSNAGVISFSVLRTYEDPTDPWAYWEEVSSVPCNSSRSFKCTDNNVFPGFISYCIVAVMSDGSTVQSEISTEHIVSH